MRQHRARNLQQVMRGKQRGKLFFWCFVNTNCLRSLVEFVSRRCWKMRAWAMCLRVWCENENVYALSPKTTQINPQKPRAVFFTIPVPFPMHQYSLWTHFSCACEVESESSSRRLMSECEGKLFDYRFSPPSPKNHKFHSFRHYASDAPIESSVILPTFAMPSCRQ